MAFWETIEIQLRTKGFQPVQDRPRWYFRIENPVLYVLCLLDGREETFREESATFTDFSRRLTGRLSDFQCTRLVALSVLVDKEDNPTVETVESGDNPFDYGEAYYRVFWQFSTETARVSASQGQPNRLLGIEKLLAAAAAGKAPEVILLRDTAQQKPPVATAVIFLICALLLVWMTLSGQRTDIILQYGLGAEGIRNGEYYRFLTSMFLHSGIMHLASNCVYLYYFGARSEKLLGTGKFLLLYLVSGFCGGLLSVLLGDGYGVSIGASGAIYGLLGAMLLLTRKRGAAYTGMSYSTMLLLAATAIGMGFLEPGVDNLGHIGGFLGGMGMFALLLRK
ncbi:MAG: rhomboid family intramembrane serine protease [Bacillota bacterium]|nr:rhomboid family intramembrane serine protease [Bacillota bacterium]